MCSASICLWFPFLRPPQILPRSKESLTLVFLELFSTGCPIGFTQVGVESWISFDREAVKWNLICVQWALYAPISNLVDFRSLNFVQRFKSRSSQSSWHCQHKSFQSKFWILKSHKLNSLRQKMPLLLQNSFQPHQSEFWAPVWLLGLPKMATGSPGPSSTTHLCRQVTKFVWIFLDLNFKFIQEVSWIHT